MIHRIEKLYPGLGEVKKRIHWGEVLDVSIKGQQDKSKNWILRMQRDCGHHMTPEPLSGKNRDHWQKRFGYIDFEDSQ